MSSASLFIKAATYNIGVFNVAKAKVVVCGNHLVEVIDWSLEFFAISVEW